MLRANLAFLLSLPLVFYMKVAGQSRLMNVSDGVPSGTYFVYMLDSIVKDLQLEFLSLPVGDPEPLSSVGGDDSDLFLAVVPWNPDQIDAFSCYARSATEDSLLKRELVSSTAWPHLGLGTRV